MSRARATSSPDYQDRDGDSDEMDLNDDGVQAEAASRPSLSWPTRPGPASAKYARIEKEAVRQRNTPGGRAMHNPEVLMNVGRNMCEKSLSSLRETSKLWNREFIPQFRERHTPLELVGRSYLDFFGPTFALMPFVNKFIQLQNSCPSGLLPFARYRLFVFGPDQPASMNRLFSECGSSMKRVELLWKTLEQLPTAQLRRWVFEDASNLEELILRCRLRVGWREGEDQTQEQQDQGQGHSLVKTIPNLKRVSVSSRWCDPDHGSAFTRLIADIMHCAPNLESVEVNDGKTDKPWHFNLRLLMDLRDSVPDLGKLKILKLDVVSTSGLLILVKLGQRNGQAQRFSSALRLKEFCVNIFYKIKREPEDGNGNEAGAGLLEEVAPLLHSFLITQAPSLRKLGLKFQGWRDQFLTPRPRPKIPIQIPCMPALYAFKLEREGQRSDVTVLFEGTSFENAFPSLRCVSYTYNLYSDDFLGRNEDNSLTTTFSNDLAQMYHPGVKELVLHEVSQEKLAQFPPSFPALTQLEVWHNEDWVSTAYFGDHSIYEEYWTWWPQLCRLNNEKRDNDRAGAVWHPKTSITLPFEM